MSAPNPKTEGLDARRAALRILDRVLRTGQTVDSAAQGAKPLKPDDQALSLAIVPVLILYLIFSRQLIRGITAGAVK